MGSSLSMVSLIILRLRPFALSAVLALIILLQFTRSASVALPAPAPKEKDTWNTFNPHTNGSARTEPGNSPDDLYVFFGSVNKPWKINDWIEVSDSVRGGASSAKLSLLNPSNQSAGVRFQGNLDTKALGGAAFASQAYRYPMEIENDKFNAFFIEIYPVNSSVTTLQTFSFIVKDISIGSTPDGKPTPSLSYEYKFQAPKSENPQGDLEHLVQFKIPFTALKAVYRGKPKSGSAPFDPTRIGEITIMCRSFFNQQSGHFQLDVGRIGLIPNTNH